MSIKSQDICSTAYIRGKASPYKQEKEKRAQAQKGKSPPTDAAGSRSGGLAFVGWGRSLETRVAASAARTGARRAVARARRSAAFALRLLGLILRCGLGQHTLVADFVGAQTEVGRIGAEVHARLGDVHISVKLGTCGHDLALERRRKRPETTEVHDVAVGHHLTRHISCEVQHALHFHVVEGRVSGYHLTEALEAHAMTPRRGGLDDHLAFVGADAHLTFAEGVADGFVFLAHNHLRRLQQVVLAPVGDIIRGQGKLCFSSSESLSA